MKMIRNVIPTESSAVKVHVQTPEIKIFIFAKVYVAMKLARKTLITQPSHRTKPLKVNTPRKGRKMNITITNTITKRKLSLTEMVRMEMMKQW